MLSPRASLRVVVVAALLAALGAGLVTAPALARPPHATHIVQLGPGTTLAEGRVLVHAAGGRVTGTLPIINAVAVRMSAGSVSALARDPHVAAVTANSGVAPQTVTPAAPDPNTTAATVDPAAPAPDTSRLASAYPASVPALQKSSTCSRLGATKATWSRRVGGFARSAPVSWKSSHSENVPVR